MSQRDAQCRLRRVQLGSRVCSQAEQVACVQNTARRLATGGCLVVELFVPDLRPLTPGKSASAFRTEPRYIGLDTRGPASQHLVTHFRFAPDIGEDRRAHVFRRRHRYIWPAELDLMAQLARLNLESSHSDWRGDSVRCRLLRSRLDLSTLR